MKELSNVLKAMSDETRLQMLALLAGEGELCVCDVVAALDISQSKASRHLRHLVQAGLLLDRKQGVWVHFRIVEQPGPTQAVLLDALSGLLAEHLPEGVRERLAGWLVRKETEGVACIPTKTKRR